MFGVSLTITYLINKFLIFSNTLTRPCILNVHLINMHAANCIYRKKMNCPRSLNLAFLVSLYFAPKEER